MRCTNADRGFTLLELVTVIVIIGVLSVVATARMSSKPVFDAPAYADELAAAASYAQRYAVASGCSVRFQLTGTGFSLVMENTPCPTGVYGTSLIAPTGGTFSGSTPTGVSVSGTGNYDFDAYGDVTSGGTITVSGGGASKSFTIQSGSGYVDRQ